MSKVQLSKNLVVKSINTVPTREGAEVWRTNVHFIDQAPKAGGIVKDYYVWVTGVYLEDEAGMTADIESAKEHAPQVAKRRFEESGNIVPEEDGISLSNSGEEIIDDYKSFIHFSEMDESNR